MDEVNLEDFGIEKNKIKNLTMNEKMEEIHSLLFDKDNNKHFKKLKLPRKAKIKKGRMKKGWVGLLFLNENRTIQGQKVKLEGGTFITKDNNYHVTDGSELIFWEGKYPVLFQRHDKFNPSKILTSPSDKNEVYGQDTVYLRMKKDLTAGKKERGKTNWIYIGIFLVAGYFLIKAFFPQLLGG